MDEGEKNTAYFLRLENKHQSHNYLRDIEMQTKLTDDDFFDKFPTLKECSEAVFEMKNNKSPGLDGLPVEFYKMF